MERFDMRYVRGHVEVFDWRGEFCFSADSMAEAMEELREQSAASCSQTWSAARARRCTSAMLSPPGGVISSSPEK